MGRLPIKGKDERQEMEEGRGKMEAKDKRDKSKQPR